MCAAILLTTRHLDIALPTAPENCWWELFDAEWDDLWSVCGWIMRLYRDRPLEDRMRVMGLVAKKGVRQWLEEHHPAGGEVRRGACGMDLLGSSVGGSNLHLLRILTMCKPQPWHASFYPDY